MPKFRSIRSPERQAEAVVGRLVNLGALRRNPARPASVRTVANYRDCLLQIAGRIAPEGRELRDLTPETAVEYLRSRTANLGQKALDMHASRCRPCSSMSPGGSPRANASRWCCQYRINTPQKCRLKIPHFDRPAIGVRWPLVRRQGRWGWSF